MKQQLQKQPLLILAILSSLLVTPLHAVDFVSGSDGTDGALNITSSVEFSEVTFPSLDSDGDGIYHFTTINIDAGAVVTFSKALFAGRPVYWLASGDVTIAGEVDLDGEDGADRTPSSSSNALPGPGGYAGGKGCSSMSKATDGHGPGGAPSRATSNNAAGSGAGYLLDGTTGAYNSRGISYGNVYLLPLLGGSGGGGGSFSQQVCTTDSSAGGGGGAGGGAMLLASSTTINITGSVHADGGHGGKGQTASNGFAGGAGSGGALRLLADNIIGSGTFSVQGGKVYSDVGVINAAQHGRASVGYIKLESYQRSFSGTMQSPAFYSIPGPVFLDAAQNPVRVVSIGGVAVPASPHARITAPDVVINSAVASTIELEAHGIPLGTAIQLTLIPELGDSITVSSTTLAGTLENSTATASVTIPYGFSHFYVEVTW